MEGETSWIDYQFDDNKTRELDLRVFDSYPELNDDDNSESNLISIDSILPDDLLERILALLPIVSIFKAGAVSRKWYEIVHSRRFLCNASRVLVPKPWYFMFTGSDEPIGYAYDPMDRKWYSFQLPYIETSSCFIASSYGLVCFMDNDSRSELYVCNLITKDHKKLVEPPGQKFPDYSALALSVDSLSHSYTAAVVKSKQIPNNFIQWNLSIHFYSSETGMWVSPVKELMTGWRGGDDSVICDGVLYFLVHSTTLTGNQHALATFNLSSRPSNGLLIDSFIPVPCSLTCGRLMNMKGKLVMVGGIGKQDRPGIIKGIGIWALKGRDWEEVSRMPHRFFQGFGEFDDVFASSGFDNLVYIQSYGGPALLVFDMSSRQWKWSQKCPVAKRFPLQLFTGFCFQPRLETAP